MILLPYCGCYFKAGRKPKGVDSKELFNILLVHGRVRILKKLIFVKNTLLIAFTYNHR
jgi:hypothetical protein